MSKPHQSQRGGELTAPSEKTMTNISLKVGRNFRLQLCLKYLTNFVHVQITVFKGDLGTPDQIPVFALTSKYLLSHTTWLAGLNGVVTTRTPTQSSLNRGSGFTIEFRH